MNDGEFRSAPNFTTACIVMFGINLSWILFAIWAVWGLIIAMLVSAGINHGMTRVHAWSAERQKAAIKRGKPFYPKSQDR